MEAPEDARPDDPVVIVDYDPRWPEAFTQEMTLLQAVIGPFATGGIHHVGSTAVPGLAAKPVIDILVGVDSLDASVECINLVVPLHYVYAAYRADEMHWFCKPGPSERTHHLHLVPTDSQRFVHEIVFRDYLRAHEDRAVEYGSLKRRLALEFAYDREAYTQGKTDFVHETLALATSGG